MRRLRICAALVTGALMAGAMPAAAADLPADTDAYIRKAVDGGTYVGVIVGLVEDGEVVVRSFGFADKAKGKAPDADTIWEIGSITKTFTGTVLAGEVIAGRMKLDDPVQKYLPAGMKMPQLGERPITIGDLATHHSGLPRLPASFVPADPADPYASIDESALWEMVRNTKPSRPPGTAFEYSNFGYGLLGALIVRETGVTYARLVADRIFRPLAMTRSVVADGVSVPPGLAQGYDGTGKPVRHWTFKAVPGLGGIHSSMGDMLAYLRANMAAAANKGPATPLHQAMALALQPRAEMGQGKIGLAWMSSPGNRMFAHDGGTYGFSSYIGFTPDGRRGVVVLANTLATEVTSSLGAHLIDPAVPLPPLLSEVMLAAPKLAVYVGRYAITPELQVIVMQRDGRIEVAMAGQPPTTAFASSADHFYFKIVPVQMHFDRDAAGRIIRLVSHQNGQRFRAARVGIDGKPVPQPARLALTPAQLDLYVGRYRMSPEAILTVSRDGDRLLTQMSGQPAAVPVFSERTDHFEYDLLDADLDFERDAAGKVVAVAASMGPNKARGEKLPEDKAP
jgi:CubicO group peptidase (beta-lactamase class C family)